MNRYTIERERLRGTNWGGHWGNQRMMGLSFNGERVMTMPRKERMALKRRLRRKQELKVAKEEWEKEKIPRVLEMLQKVIDGYDGFDKTQISAMFRFLERNGVLIPSTNLPDSNGHLSRLNGHLKQNGF